ncbi:uncharacterized protein [Neodiprion pinetum]|uniref:uncharacterized protein n=1 Tax=Neodiprion pinetum TaxID=441929 RepID=UPI001EDEDD7F|nr:uncharacterized protein LOC124217594 [Neodiprion pinetum]XP_046479398.1 uncharacterized protein LOC124217594 [Neodiprion pinetum]
MSSCFSWGYFLKKLRIRRKRAPTPASADTSAAGGERQREDLPEMPNPMQVQHLPTHKNNKYDVTLLHPDWRKFPHTPLYGWTNIHAQQLTKLNRMIVNGNLESAYYNSDIEYRAAKFGNNFTVLPPPNVSGVAEVVLLLRRSRNLEYNFCCSDTLAEYDADDESENSMRSQRYYNHDKPRRHIRQQTAV